MTVLSNIRIIALCIIQTTVIEKRQTESKIMVTIVEHQENLKTIELDKLVIFIKFLIKSKNHQIETSVPKIKPTISKYLS